MRCHSCAHNTAAAVAGRRLQLRATLWRLLSSPSSWLAALPDAATRGCATVRVVTGARGRHKHAASALGVAGVVGGALIGLSLPRHATALSAPAAVLRPDTRHRSPCVTSDDETVLPMSPHHRQLAMNLMETLDQNQDGTLTFSELLKLTDMTEPHWSDKKRRAKAELLMQEMDADKDGTVSPEEFIYYIERQYESFEERRHLFTVISAIESLEQWSSGALTDDRRATTIVQQLEISQIATLVNAIVDLQYFDEDQEQEIFEDCVAQVLFVVDKLLPHPYKQLIVNRRSDDTEGLPDNVAEPLKVRLERSIEKSLTLSCLEEAEERRLRTAVVEILVESMKPGHSLEDVTDARKSGKLIMNVFIRGSVAMMQSSQRDSVVDTVTQNIEVPFVPVAIRTRVVEYMLEKIEKIVEEAINNLYLHHTKPKLVPIDFDHDKFHKEVEQELVDLMLPLVSHAFLPAGLADRTVRKFVEHTVLAVIDVDRLGEAMEYIVSKQELASEEKTALLRNELDDGALL